MAADSVKMKSRESAVIKLELSLLRHAHLEPSFSFELEGKRRYTASLATAPTALAPAYALLDEQGAIIGQAVLPSSLQDVELHLLAWLTCWDQAHFQ